MSAVMTEATPSAADAAVASMQELFERQRKAFLDDLPVSADLRRDRLSRAIAMLVDHQDDLCEAMRADFGHRPLDLSKFADVVGSVTALRHARSHVRRWMKPDRRPVRFPLGLIGARARIEHQPKGVVGIISPWNFPVAMSFQPLAGAFAAGNRVMLKPSEATPATSNLMARLVAEHFDETEFTVVTGGPEVGIAFSQLPFDHLFFTGSTTVGRHIMRAAADNLTPVTLELGGKSPAIIGSGADIEQAAERIALGKMMNAGQVCLAPDYVLVPEAEQSRFVDALKARVQSMYPQAAGNDDYTMVVNDRHADRIRGLVKEATEAGAEVINAQPTHEDGADRRIPLTLVLNPDEELGVMREEIFGPILPIRTYGKLDEAIDYVNANDRPLGLYFFGPDAGERRRTLDETISGGVTLDDVIFHISVEDLPFGGTGNSGIGNYHGVEGFRTFSHAKSVYKQTKLNFAKLIGLIPPYGKRIRTMMQMDLKK